MIKKIIIPIILILCMTGLVNASFLNMKTDTCTSSWYCTQYDSKNCGYRECIDVNACEIQTNIPQQYLNCENSNPKELPEGYFDVSNEVIKVTLTQGKIIQKIIKINSTSPREYLLDIAYPTSYTKGTDFFTTSKNKKTIESEGDFNIIIDSRNIFVGTYVIPVKISNNNYSRTILAIVDVVSNDNPKIDLSIDSSVKNSIPKEELKINTNIKKSEITKGDKLTYSIIDPKGNVITQQDKEIESNINSDNIPIMEELAEGYYTLAIKIDTNSGTYVKSQTFTILTPSKYTQIISDMPKKHYVLIIIISALSLIGFMITFFKTNLFINRNRFGKRYKYYRSMNRFQISMKLPRTMNLQLGVGEMLRKIKKIFRPTREVIDPYKKAELLKRSYDRGFISLKEYNEALNIQGRTIDKKVINNHHKEILIEKEEERIAKQTKQEKSIEREFLKEKEEKEKQQREMEKAEAEILKQEEELKRELAHQKEEKERIELEDKKKREEEKIKELKVEREIKQLKEEILIEQKEIKELKEKAETETIIEKTSEYSKPVNVEVKERTIVHPMSHLMVKDVSKEKENILDKRVHDHQAFGLHNGERLHSLKELMHSLPRMPEYVFEHHTKHGRNDFANWTADVFKYYDVAERIRDTNSKEEMIKVLKDYE